MTRTQDPMLDEGRWLRPILVWSLVISVALVVLEVSGRAVQADPDTHAAGFVLGAFVLAEVAALVALRRKRVGLAASVFTWALLAMSLASTPLTTFVTPPLMLLPLFAMAVGLPFLRGAPLHALFAGACVTELWVTLSAVKFLPHTGPVPARLGQFLFVASTTLIAMLIAFLLQQFSRRIRGALDVAREAASVREAFLSTASHELQTPLTVLKLQLQGLLQRSPGDTERVEAKLRAAEAQVSRLSLLVTNMLDLSRLQAGKLKLELADTSLAAAVQRVVDELRPLAERAGSRVEVTVAQAPVGRWDALRVEQVVANLLSNAIKYGEGKPIHITVDQEGALARLAVRDQGVGISEEELGRLFVQFERGAGARPQSGVGLGLCIAKQLSEAMGGTVTVKSQPREGATFTLELPVRPGVRTP